MAQETWREVAEALAARMVYQANNCPHGYAEPGQIVPEGHEPHDSPEAHAHECPFCADTAAYNRYLAKRAGKPRPKSSG